MGTRLWIGFALLFVLIPFLGVAQTQKKQVTWYVPIEADFRPEYNRDTANQARQTWNSYAEWVRSFYAGSFLSAGWTAQGRSILASVRYAAAQQELLEMLNYLGKKIAREWAKDNGIRKINTSDLSVWGRTLTDAKSRDTGTGARIKQSIIDINNQADKKLGNGRN